MTSWEYRVLMHRLSRISFKLNKNDYNSKSEEEKEKILDIPITGFFKYQDRIKNALNSANVYTIRDLISMYRHDVEKIKNIGHNSFLAIEERLGDMGLELKIYDY